MKKILTLSIVILAMVLLLCAVPVSAVEAAATGGNCGGVTWMYYTNDQSLVLRGNDWYDSNEMWDIITYGIPWDEYTSSIQTVVIADNVDGVNLEAFAGCSELTTITIGKNVADVGSCTLFGCKNLVSISVSEENPYFFTDEYGVLYNKDQTQILRMPQTYSGDYSVHSSVRIIGAFAFQGCTGLTKIDMPDAINEMGMYAFYDCDALTYVHIPDGLTKLPQGAFYGCDELVDVDLSGISEIGGSAFYCCRNLNSITIPDTVTSIGGWAFDLCRNMKYAIIGKNVAYIDSAAFNHCYGLEDIVFTGDAPEFDWYGQVFHNVNATAYYPTNNETWTEDVMQDYYGTITWATNDVVESGTVGYGLEWVLTESGTLTISGIGSMTNYTAPRAPWLSHASDIKAVLIEDGVTNIDDNAFEGCENLVAVRVSDSVSSIGSSAFSGCTSLSHIYTGRHVEMIGSRAFYGCTALNTVIFGNYLTDIRSQAFLGCKALNNVIIPNGITTINEGVFQDCDSLTNITLSENLTSIGSQAFAFCDELHSIVIPESVTTIDRYAFSDCNNLSQIVIPDNVTSIGEWAFESCDMLVSVKLGEALETIGENAFNHCTALSGITIPDNVITIGAGAFRDCWQLFDVVISDSVTTIGDYAFYNCTQMLNVTMGANITSIGDYAFTNCSSLTSVEIPDGVTTIGNGAFNGCTVLQEIVIPNSVTTIGDNAFSCCTWLGNVTLGPSVTSIGECAFQGCEWLSSITIPESVTSIGKFAFDSCWRLTRIWVEQGNDYYSSDEYGVLFDKNKTVLICMPRSYDSEYRVPQGVTSIADRAFFSSTVTEVYLPDTLIDIGDEAFQISNLHSLVIPASVTTIGEYAFSCCNNLSQIKFNGDAPAFGENVFNGITATAQYPVNSHWPTEVMENCGGSITWVSYQTLGIESQPTTQKVKAGTTATFRVGATGEGLTYQWQYKTSSTGEWKNTSSSSGKTATLKFTASTDKSGYYYRCEITDSDGDVIYSNTVRLYVLGVTSQPTTQKVKDGSTVKFTVSATGAGKTYQWQYKTSSSGSWKNTSSTSGKTATLKFTASTAKNGYYYRCKITDSAGNVVYTDTVRLHVLGIKTQPTTQKVKTGSTVKLSVTATGAGKTYQWYYKTSSSGSWKKCSSSSATTATLKFTASTAKNGYYYRCKVTDNAGNSVYTDTVRLYVLGIKTQPTNKTVSSGKTVKFTVEATGSGLTYQWQYKTSSSGSWKNTSSSSGKTATLKFTASSAKNGYYYRCKITDSAGNVIYTNAVKLTVK